MSPKVTYWTGTWDSEKEAISKEINQLRTGDRARSPVIAFSEAHRFRYDSREHVLQLPASSWLVLRAVAGLIERRGHVSHVFGGQSSWHSIRALGRRPILLTAAVATRTPISLPQGRIAKVVVESDSVVEQWQQSGIARHDIEVIRPGVDLDHFQPTNRSRPLDGPITLVFASTPASPDQIPRRGIARLVELARLRSDVRITIPWRQWGDVEGCKRALEALAPPSNFQVCHEPVEDMRKIYAAADATIVCFDEGEGKISPNFVIEGFAAGLPCIAVRSTGIASDILKGGAGCVVDNDIRALDQAVDAVRENWPALSGRARSLAAEEFDVRRFQAGYARIYELLAGRAAPGS